MKILHICSYYQNVLFENLVAALRKHGMENEVYIFLPKEERENDFPNKKENIRLSYCYNKWERVFFHLKHTKVDRDFTEKYCDTIKEYDCVYAHSLFSNGYIAYKAKKKWGTPYIVMVQNTDLNVFFKRMKHLVPLGRNILKEADKIIFASQSYLNEALDKYVEKACRKEIESKSVVIPYGIDDYYFTQNHHCY